MWRWSRLLCSPQVVGTWVIMTTVLGRPWARASFVHWTAVRRFLGGRAGQVEVVEEWRVELVVGDDLIRQVVAALKQSHPYETPAYEVYRLVDF